MELSRRMQAVADLVTKGNPTADIGTDHAYVPIALLEQGRIPFAIAMDINEGPLERAREHTQMSAHAERIELRLSDGLEKLFPGEVQTAILAGMGGGLVIRILLTGWEVTCSMKELVLQPQSEIAKVRKFLLDHAFQFQKEDMVFEDGKYYPMMNVTPPASEHAEGKNTWSEVELAYGKLLLEERHPVLKQFLEREKKLHTDIAEKLETQSGDGAKKRIEELKQEICLIKKGLEYYEVQRDPGTDREGISDISSAVL